MTENPLVEVAETTGEIEAVSFEEQAIELADLPEERQDVHKPIEETVKIIVEQPS